MRGARSADSAAVEAHPDRAGAFAYAGKRLSTLLALSCRSHQQRQLRGPVACRTHPLYSGDMAVRWQQLQHTKRRR
jgi:hypothetical protein